MERLIWSVGPAGGSRFTHGVVPKLPGNQMGTLSLLLLGAWSIATTGWAEEPGWINEPRRLGLLKPATQLIGRVVEDRRNKPIGKIQDLLLDIPSGRVLVTLISTGKGSELIPVPAESYTFVSKTKLVMGEEKSALKTAPRVSTTFVSTGPTASRLKDSFVCFHEKLPKAATNGERRLSSSAALLRAPLLGQNEEELGLVNDIMVDLQRGSLVYFVVQPASRTDRVTELYVVPAISLRSDPARRVVVLDTDKTHFLAGPHFSNEFWTDMAFSDMSKAVCRHFGLQDEGSIQSNLRQSGGGTNGAWAQERQPSVERADTEITEAVLDEIMKPGNGFVNLDIIVTTVHGRVTLRGIVKNEKQEQQVIAAVERVVGTGKVEDRLETKGKIKAAQL